MAVLLHGDCLEVMKTLPDKSVDLFLCDLPYGCLNSGKATTIVRQGGEYASGKVWNADTERTIAPCGWDIKIDLAQFWTQVKRLCRDDHTPVILFCSTKFGFELYNSNPDWFRYDLVWNKQRGVSFLLANKQPMRSHEMMYVFSKKGARYYRKDITGEFNGTRRRAVDGTTNVYNATSIHSRDTSTTERCALSVIDSQLKSKKGNHPTQKPDDLYAWLIERYSKEGDTILDPTAGSFASVFTAHKMNRKAIGIEMDKTFYDKAAQITSLGSHQSDTQ